jgi:probable rRNA maturation factor
MKYGVHLNVGPEFESFAANLVEIAQTTFIEVDAEPGEMTLALVDTTKIQALNAEFRNLDQPTDVLAFTDDRIDPETEIRYFGDVVIAVPVAQRQADAAGHPLQAELSLLTVHGVLHLLGFDHHLTADKITMWGIQSAILEKCGLHIVQPD